MGSGPVVQGLSAGSGTPHERNTAAHDLGKPVWNVGLRRESHTLYTERKTVRTILKARGLTFGSPANGLNVEAGSSQGMAALDSAARPEHAEGKKTSREAVRVQPDPMLRDGEGSIRSVQLARPVNVDG